MKSFALGVLVIGAVLAVYPAALVAQSYDFTLSGTGVNASGVFDVTEIGNTGVDEVTGVTGTFIDSNVPFTGPIIGIIGYGLTASPPSYSTTSPSEDSIGQTLYDDLLYPDSNSPPLNFGYPGDGGALVDVLGILFNVQDGSNVFEVNIWNSNNGVYDYSVQYSNSDEVEGIPGVLLNFNVSNAGAALVDDVSAPEGGASPLYLLLAGAACAGAMFFSRSRFADLASA